MNGDWKQSKTDTCNRNNVAKFVPVVVIVATVVNVILARPWKRCLASLCRRSVTDTLLCMRIVQWWHWQSLPITSKQVNHCIQSYTDQSTWTGWPVPSSYMYDSINVIYMHLCNYTYLSVVWIPIMLVLVAHLAYHSYRQDSHPFR